MNEELSQKEEQQTTVAAADADTQALSPEEIEELEKNFAKVRAQIALAAREAGRSEEPLLLAATKRVEPRRINYAIRHLGLTDIGENRVQELLEKYPYYDKSARLHFIGTLQKNKVKYIVDRRETM